MDWLYNLAVWKLFVLVPAILVGVFVVGLFFIRPFVRIWIRGQVGANDLVGVYLSYFGVIYGLLLGLLAVAAYQNRSEAEKMISNEAVACSSLSRCFDMYPESTRGRLTELMRSYLDSVIFDDWPVQRRGGIPTASKVFADKLNQVINRFKPEDENQKLAQSQTIEAYHEFVQARRTRINSVKNGLPPQMWTTLVIGSIISIVLVWCFEMKIRPLLFLGSLIIGFNGTLIALLISLDNPFRSGDMAASAAVFKETLKSEEETQKSQSVNANTVVQETQPVKERAHGTFSYQDEIELEFEKEKPFRVSFIGAKEGTAIELSSTSPDISISPPSKLIPPNNEPVTFTIATKPTARISSELIVNLRAKREGALLAENTLKVQIRAKSNCTKDDLEKFLKQIDARITSLDDRLKTLPSLGLAEGSKEKVTALRDKVTERLSRRPPNNPVQIREFIEAIESTFLQIESLIESRGT